MQIKEKKELEVTVDKRHIISIGERLYTESVELLRELINNAYDADATEVRVELDPEKIVVADDGSGMDAEGLKQYFIIGSDEKVLQSMSPKFGRERIGQFGIGKFASLSAATRFEVITQQGEFAARVIFDKNDWETAKRAWHLPCEILLSDFARGDGTTVILSGLTKPFDMEEAEEKIREGVPLKAPHFAIYLNGRRIEPHVCRPPAHPGNRTDEGDEKPAPGLQPPKQAPQGCLRRYGRLILRSGGSTGNSLALI